ncbi:MAG: hypothetical protein ACRDUV_25610 [Pseudonocardiaceae bacterium]
MVRLDHDSVLAGAERIDTGFVVEFSSVVRRVAAGGLQSHADRKQRAHPHKGEALEANKRRPLREFIDGRLVSCENRHSVDPVDGVVSPCICTNDHGFQVTTAHENIIIAERGSGSDMALLHQAIVARGTDKSGATSGVLKRSDT